MKKTAVKSQDIDAYLAETRGLERDWIAELVRSRKTAWGVAKGMGGLAALSLVTVCFMMPLKKTEAFVVATNPETGAAEVVSKLDGAQTTYGETTDKYFLNQYVTHREAYDYNTLQLDYDTVSLLSAQLPRTEYASQFQGSKAKHKVLLNSVRTVVSVVSITPNNPGVVGQVNKDGKGKDGTATVRFTTVDQRPDLTADPPKHWIATIAYSYVPDAEISEKDRRINPLGFQVKSYRVDPETVTQ